VVKEATNIKSMTDSSVFRLAVASPRQKILIGPLPKQRMERVLRPMSMTQDLAKKMLLRMRRSLRMPIKPTCAPSNNVSMSDRNR
jgi:hypothetical protein